MPGLLARCSTLHICHNPAAVSHIPTDMKYIILEARKNECCLQGDIVQVWREVFKKADYAKSSSVCEWPLRHAINGQ